MTTPTHPEPTCAPPSFQVGDDVFVRDPQRFVPDCTCIVGPVVTVRQNGERIVYGVEGSVGKMGGGGLVVALEFEARDLGHRIWTPISQLSGRPCSLGFDRFCEIAASWGYP